jgi:hypothetical protein
VAVAYAVGFVAARGVDRSLGGIGGTACALAAGTLAYVAVVVAAGGLVRRDRERLALLLSRLRARAPARRS